MSAPGVSAVTVTPNPAVDQTIWIPGFRPGEVNRVVREDVTAGGKGVNVAAFLADFGVPVAATGFLGEANAGLFHAFLAGEGIPADFVSVPGATRTGVKVVDEVAGTTTDINFPGFEVSAEHVRALEERLAAAVEPGRWVVLAGSLPRGAPPDLYGRLAELARERGGLVALDTSGPALAAAIEAGPALVKPNREELEELTGRSLGDRAELLRAAQSLGAETVIVSMGADGALFARDGEVAFATPPPVKVASTVGAGDAMVAGAIAGALRGLSLEDQARLATAFSAVAIAAIGPHLDADAVQRTAAQVAVEQNQLTHGAVGKGNQ